MTTELWCSSTKLVDTPPVMKPIHNKYFQHLNTSTSICLKEKQIRLDYINGNHQQTGEKLFSNLGLERVPLGENEKR